MMYVTNIIEEATTIGVLWLGVLCRYAHNGPLQVGRQPSSHVSLAIGRQVDLQLVIELPRNIACIFLNSRIY